MFRAAQNGRGVSAPGRTPPREDETFPLPRVLRCLGCGLSRVSPQLPPAAPVATGTLAFLLLLRLTLPIPGDVPSMTVPAPTSLSVRVCGGEGRRGEGKSQIRGDARLLMTRRQRPRARRVTRLGGFEKPSGRRPSFEGLGQAGSRKDSFISRIALSAFKSLRCISNHTDGGVRSCGRCENESVHLRGARGASSSASSRAQPHMDFGVGGGPAPAPRLRAPRNTCRLISRVTLPHPPPQPPLGLCFEKMPEVVFIIPEQSPRGRSVARRMWQMAT